MRGSTTCFSVGERLVDNLAGLWLIGARTFRGVISDAHLASKCVAEMAFLEDVVLKFSTTLAHGRWRPAFQKSSDKRPEDTTRRGLAQYPSLSTV